MVFLKTNKKPHVFRVECCLGGKKKIFSSIEQNAGTWPPSVKVNVLIAGMSDARYFHLKIGKLLLEKMHLLRSLLILVHASPAIPDIICISVLWQLLPQFRLITLSALLVKHWRKESQCLGEHLLHFALLWFRNIWYTYIFFFFFPTLTQLDRMDIILFLFSHYLVSYLKLNRRMKCLILSVFR